MELPALSVLRAKSTYAIGAAIGLLVTAGYLPAAEPQAAEALFMGYAAVIWAAFMQLCEFAGGVWAWVARMIIMRRLTLTGAERPAGVRGNE